MEWPIYMLQKNVYLYKNYFFLLFDYVLEQSQIKHVCDRYLENFCCSTRERVLVCIYKYKYNRGLKSLDTQTDIEVYTSISICT